MSRRLNTVVLVSLLSVPALAQLPSTPGQALVNIPPVSPPPPTGTVITVLGDSIATGAVPLPCTPCFPTLLQPKITAAGLSYTVNNQGKGGRRASEGLLVIDGLLAANPALLVLELGGGDGRSAVPIATIRANLGTMIQKAQTKHIPVLLLGIFLTADPVPATATQYQKDFAAMWPSLATQYGLPVVPNMYVGFTAADVQADGYHPSVSGAAKIANTVWPVLQAMFAPVPPPGPTTHAYFDMLRAKPDAVRAYSLRDAAQVLSLKAQNAREPAVTYGPATDPDPRKQDAAKVVVPAGVPSLPNQLRIPLGTKDGERVLVTWDAWFGKEFAVGVTQIPTFKTFQFAAPRSTANPALHFEVRNRWQPAGGVVLPPGYSSQLDTRAYTPTPIVTPLPQVGTFLIKAETWTRYWVLIDQTVPPDPLYSLWIADKGRAPVQILDRQPVPFHSTAHTVAEFWVEYNTSTNSTTVPARVSYVRNIVMLRNVGNVASVLVPPS